MSCVSTSRSVRTSDSRALSSSEKMPTILKVRRPNLKSLPIARIGIARQQLAADDHFGSAVRHPTTALDAHQAVDLARDRIDPAEQSPKADRAGLIRRRIEAGDHFGRHQRLAGCGRGDLRAALDDLVLVARDVAAALVGGAAAQHDPVVTDSAFQNGGAQARDESRQDEKDHHHQRDHHRGHHAGSAANHQTAQIVANRNHARLHPQSKETHRC